MTGIFIVGHIGSRALSFTDHYCQSTCRNVILLISAPSLGVYYCQQLPQSVCLSVTDFKLLLFCFSMESSHFGPSVLHDPLHKTFFDFLFRPHNAQNLLSKF